LPQSNKHYSERQKKVVIARNPALHGMTKQSPEIASCLPQAGARNDSPEHVYWFRTVWRARNKKALYILSKLVGFGWWELENI